jgi:hypothetical protein
MYLQFHEHARVKAGGTVSMVTETLGPSLTQHLRSEQSVEARLCFAVLIPSVMVPFDNCDIYSR